MNQKLYHAKGGGGSRGGREGGRGRVEVLRHEEERSGIKEEKDSRKQRTREEEKARKGRREGEVGTNVFVYMCVWYVRVCMCGREREREEEERATRDRLRLAGEGGKQTNDSRPEDLEDSS